ncbi:MAG TPA: hypothetical protein ENF34_04790 [Candidatus Bathyarchaeota archaeon]|nr:hypothetical protein [Candidatus Bathyarchaeota archaeon]
MYERRWGLTLLCSLLILVLGTGLTWISLLKEDSSVEKRGQVSLSTGETAVIEPPDVPADLLTDVIRLTLTSDVRCSLSVSWLGRERTHLTRGLAILGLAAYESFTITLGEPAEVRVTLVEADGGRAVIRYIYMVLGRRMPYLYLAIPGAVLCLLGLGLLAMSFMRFLMKRNRGPNAHGAEEACRN